MELNEFWQRVHVSGLQLGHFAKFDDLGGQRVLRSQLLQDFRRGRPRFCLAPSRVGLQIQFVKKNLRELRRRIDVELRSRHLPDFFFQAPDFLVHSFGHFFQLFWLDANSGSFHARKHRRQRQIDLFIDFFKSLLFHLVV